MSEPQRLGEIVPSVLQTIKNRCNLYRREHGLPTLDEELGKKADHKIRTLAAVGGFMLNRQELFNKTSGPKMD